MGLQFYIWTIDSTKINNLRWDRVQEDYIATYGEINS